jgi:serine/threonine protein kinase
VFVEEKSNIAPDSLGKGAGHFVPPGIEDLNSVLDEYEFIGTIGQGGMGTVYEARQKSINRPVAIKILPRAQDDEALRFADRFQREVHVMAQMSHPNIVTVFNFGETTDEQLFFVMEYVRGSDLHQIISQGALDTDRIFKWIEQICDALFYAHSMGVIHRDIKPANILITENGDVKIADFGLAKLTGGGITDGHTRLTKTNMAMGTPDYVAPEILESDGIVDHRVDIYAIGVMLYEMLTGKVPRGAWKPPSSLVEGLHQGFDEIVIKAMDPDQELRYSDAVEFSKSLLKVRDEPPVAELASLGQKNKMVTGSAALRKMAVPPVEKVFKPIAGSANPVTPQHSPTKKKAALKNKTGMGTGNIGLIIGALVVTVVLLVVVVMRNDRRASPVAAASGGGKASSIDVVNSIEDADQPKKLTGHTGLVNGLVFLPGVPLLAVSLSGGTKTGDLTMRWWDVETGLEKNRVDKVVASSLELSTDGKLLLTSNWQGAGLYESSTGKLVRNFPFGELGVRAARISPDGKQIAMGGYNGRIALYDIDSKDPAWVLAPKYKNAVTDLAFIPGTRRIAVSYGAGKKNPPLPPRVFELGKNEALFDIEDMAGLIPSMVTTGDGRYLLAAREQESPKLFDLATGKMIRVYNGFKPFSGINSFVKSLGFFGDDRFFYAGTTDGQLGIWETESGKLVQRREREATATSNVAVSLQGGVIICGGGSLKKGGGDHDLQVLPLPPGLEAYKGRK